LWRWWWWWWEWGFRALGVVARERESNAFIWCVRGGGVFVPVKRNKDIGGVFKHSDISYILERSTSYIRWKDLPPTSPKHCVVMSEKYILCFCLSE